MNIVVIPAKGDSKRLPNKNKLCIGGIPMYQWVVNAAIASNAGQVWITTDDMEIYHQKYKHPKLKMHLRQEWERDPELGVIYLARNIIHGYKIECKTVTIALANCPEIKSADINKSICLVQHGEGHETRAMYKENGIFLRESGIWTLTLDRLFATEPSTYVCAFEVNYKEIHTWSEYDHTRKIMEKSE